MEDSERSDFMKTVGEIKLAEEESDEILKAAKIKADKILRTAKEDVQRQGAKNQEEVVALKNSLLEEGTKEIEKEVEKIISRSKKDADEIKKKKLSKKDTDALVKGFISPSK